MCLTATVLEMLATTAKWESANGCNTPRGMDMIHLENILRQQQGWNTEEVYCGLSHGEWHQVMSYEISKRNAEWKTLELKQQLKEAEAKAVATYNDISQAMAYLAEAELELASATNDHHKAAECLAKTKVMHSYANLKVRELQEKLERYQ